MNDYKKLRKALEELIDAANAHMSMRDTEKWLGNAVTDAGCVLADTAEISEIERLIPWLEEHRVTDLDDRDEYAHGQDAFIEYLLDHIKSKFGYGGEDAE